MHWSSLGELGLSKEIMTAQVSAIVELRVFIPCSCFTAFGDTPQPRAVRRKAENPLVYLDVAIADVQGEICVASYRFTS